MKYKYNTIRINLFFVICIVFLFGIFAYKLGVVALNDEVEGTNLKELAENRSTATKVLTANRGTIVQAKKRLPKISTLILLLPIYRKRERVMSDILNMLKIKR